MIKTASEFLALSALKRDKITVKGQEVHYRELSVAERTAMLKIAQESPADVPAYLVASCLTTPDGARLFTAEQAAEVSQQAPDVVDAVAAAIMSLSGLKEDVSPKD
jgi:hypothetical protein